MLKFGVIGLKYAIKDIFNYISPYVYSFVCTAKAQHASAQTLNKNLAAKKMPCDISKIYTTYYSV